jgi:hypothetical protein
LKFNVIAWSDEYNCFTFDVIPALVLGLIVNCVWNHWGQWEKCSKECGGGQQTRSRKERIPAQHGGNECAGKATETNECNRRNCPSV